MTEHMIKPWTVDEATDPLYVPDYIWEMAKEVLEHYNFTVKKMTVMALKNKFGGAIWKIETDKGPYSLKILHRRPIRSQFSLGAQEYLVKKKKARVPAIIKTMDGNNSVEMGGKLWFVAEWIESLQFASDDLKGTKKLCYALGEFHQLTKGYVPPAGAEHVSRLHRWPRTYERMEKKMGWFRDIANAYHNMPASSTILSVIDKYEKQVRKARKRLDRSPYEEIVSKGPQENGLVHQDYGWSNAQMGKKGMWVIDLDGVAYDITIRDLRKLIEARMESLEQWDIKWVREMIRAYHKAKPISPEEYELLLIDLSLPNAFYKTLKEILYSPKTTMNEELDQELQQIIALDKQKRRVIKHLAKGVKGGSRKI